MGIEVEGGEKILQKMSEKMTRPAKPVPMTIHLFPKLLRLFLLSGSEYGGNDVTFGSFNRSC
jgi:hypothetical protein